MWGKSRSERFSVSALQYWLGDRAGIQSVKTDCCYSGDGDLIGALNMLRVPICITISSCSIKLHSGLQFWHLFTPLVVKFWLLNEGVCVTHGSLYYNCACWKLHSSECASSFIRCSKNSVKNSCCS